MNARSPLPSLFGQQEPAGVRAAAAESAHESPRDARSLLDLLYDGCYMIFLLRNGQAPADAGAFRERLRSFLGGFERGAQRLNQGADNVFLAKFAFCALVDEVVLTSDFRIRDEWEVRPLQLEFFGEQLAGERFFEYLDQLRQDGAPRVQVLEVYHLCLLLGFQGRYLLEGSEKLGYLTARLGEDIAHLRGRRAAFAPHGEPPDRIVHQLKREVPLWVIGAVFALVGTLGFIGLKWSLSRHTATELAAHQGVVKLAPQAAHVTITLP
ncbi:DotU family type IV/VI secretion system protein [Aquincola sp. S2]|uniref:DotU family type IV/VI secretion system protein n=1 Tax=Pseudaquabacterium terrae TaxID=2732868 RepID=A0ABX2ELN3_9BURK|nr:type IVB secretion system protein IcmH/DotU [Aquabacterium terrae]NRF69429.1 DotU family type IV/VI secretion system protein [Aquabacterium terrae]